MTFPPHTNAAYFIVARQDKYQRVALEEVIRRYAGMSVITVKDPTETHAGAVYLPLENTIMSLNDAGFVIQQSAQLETINRAIDIFFVSLAKQHGRRAVGIVLSGGGQDGAAGGTEITEHGGTVLVQDPETSLFGGKPLTMIERDHPSAVLTPAALALRIAEMARTAPR